MMAAQDWLESGGPSSREARPNPTARVVNLVLGV
jgi:hypothetical protein